MPTTDTIPVEQLRLDLKNFRTTPQKNELGAVRAMIAINPDWFWALAESLLDDGYQITENILVIRTPNGKGELVVKEGNRRVAILKLCLGHIRRGGLSMPSSIETRIGDLDSAWKEANQKVPCAIYAKEEASLVDKIVTLTHGKGEKAGRDKWKAVARARHNRDMSRGSEPALDLLERYLKNGRNLTAHQKERWGGDYPLTVLEEALKRLAPRFNVTTARELADAYPRGMPQKAAMEDILRDIGLESLGFAEIRNKDVDFALTRYGIPSIQATKGTPAPQTTTGGGGSAGPPTAGKSTKATRKTKAAATDDPRAVIRALKSFSPVGNRREKLVTLLDEARTLKLERHPHAFCFVLRSMFEISAKAYCADHLKSGGPKAAKATGEDRLLVEVLRDITAHLTKNNTDKEMKKTLHGAMAEMAKSSGFLSVTSMNQLVHHPTFSVKDTHISSLFFNIFPLLAAMNS
ncbi:MAG TPA: hypothetical protein VHC22_12750 [Pirellulales bacterium]|nr:hypothetical protein [Pirellulales bacterium]